MQCFARSLNIQPEVAQREDGFSLEICRLKRKFCNLYDAGLLLCLFKAICQSLWQASTCRLSSWPSSWRDSRWWLMWILSLTILWMALSLWDPPEIVWWGFLRHSHVRGWWTASELQKGLKPLLPVVSFGISIRKRLCPNMRHWTSTGTIFDRQSERQYEAWHY